MQSNYYQNFSIAVLNDEEYIASGVLELYAAGGLTQEEQEEVEARATVSPSVRAALDEACAAMEAYAQTYAVKPGLALKNRILSQIGDDAAPADTLQPAEEAVVPMFGKSKEASPYKWMLAASVILFLLSGFLSLYFYNKWQQAEDRLSVAIASEQRLARNFETVSQRVNQQQEALAVLRSPDFEFIRLQGVAASPEASLAVYWNPERRQVFIDLVNLPAPPPNQQYQLWALDNGKPIDAGMIALDNTPTDNLQQMKAIGSAQAFAVTLEPIGGSVSPTLEQLVVMGEIKS